MKTLLLMRHAKSSWKDPNLPDHDRPLNKRGRRDVPFMGALLVEHELVPQCIISSSALRARKTAEGVADAAHYPGDITYADRLYMGEVEDYIAELRELPNEIERVMIIGHNPGLETLLQLLSGQIESLPTAVIAHLVLPIDHWSQLSTDVPGELVEIWRPKDLREENEEKAKGKNKIKGKGKKAKEKEKSKKKEQ